MIRHVSLLESGRSAVYIYGSLTRKGITIQSVCHVIVVGLNTNLGWYEVLNYKPKDLIMKSTP